MSGAVLGGISSHKCGKESGVGAWVASGRVGNGRRERNNPELGVLKGLQEVGEMERNYAKILNTRQSKTGSKEEGKK